MGHKPGHVRVRRVLTGHPLDARAVSRVEVERVRSLLWKLTGGVWQVTHCEVFASAGTSLSGDALFTDCSCTTCEGGYMPLDGGNNCDKESPCPLDKGYCSCG